MYSRQILVLDLQTPAGMCESNDRALLFPPLQNGQIPGGPIFDALGAWVILIFESQQNQVTGVARRET